MSEFASLSPPQKKKTPQARIRHTNSSATLASAMNKPAGECDWIEETETNTLGIKAPESNQRDFFLESGLNWSYLQANIQHFPHSLTAIFHNRGLQAFRQAFCTWWRLIGMFALFTILLQVGWVYLLPHRLDLHLWSLGVVLCGSLCCVCTSYLLCKARSDRHWWVHARFLARHWRRWPVSFLAGALFCTCAQMSVWLFWQMESWLASVLAGGLCTCMLVALVSLARYPRTWIRWVQKKKQT